ncbi:MAG: YraN family protein [Gemmataceae bacterium]|nr:YraN family protein [Gemmataceae bacterium]
MRITSMPWWRRWFGFRCERVAARYLTSLGYRIVRRNYRCAFGELDLIALDRDTIVFVEVRSSESMAVDRVAASVDFRKQRRLCRIATYFLKQRRLLNHAARFDVITVCWPPTATEPKIDHFRNAFEAVE